MKIRSKFNIITLVFSVLVIITSSIVIKQINMNGYMEAEMNVFNYKLDRVKQNLINIEEELEYINNDWAKWNDTYNFILGQYPEYIDSNITIQTFYDLELNYLLIENDKGEILYGAEHSKEDDEISLIPDKIVEEFNKYKDTYGIMLFEDKYIVYSSKSITDNKGLAKPIGQIVMAFEIDQDLIEDLSEKSSLDFTFETIEEPQYQEIIKKIDKNISQGIVYIPFVNSESYIKITVELFNDISNLGTKNSNFTIIVITLVLFFFGIMIYISLNKVIISKLDRLTKQVRKITNNENINNRININGNDEFTELSTDINLMLDEIKIVNSKLNQQAQFDEMTGVLNRRAGLDRLTKAIDKKHTLGVNLIICFIDIDGLKKVNDNFGHAYGDMLIKFVVEAINKIRISSENIVRLGGDEFLIIFQDSTIEKSKIQLAQIINEVDNINNTMEMPFKISFSYGIEEYKSIWKIDEFVESADKKMYEDKRNKK
ncbi:sensor domain-containing diguanylate cyclase [Clostridium grantii]|uniref:Diguanylate cyclase (GGDEF) domain-containing protein n=1 Tax=Clostridium grantii DSM 8605 TaxID=1121316 RepID=A0A1M5X010_9CLOT|nr:diguanylate cyclase [Clostridium grantii]SHH93255.1 diguanylate cyclase (GGDEF) domain-containing protein [Clostridium grantii DSM 8605]